MRNLFKVDENSFEKCYAAQTLGFYLKLSFPYL